jgi:hypothetical protein
MTVTDAEAANAWAKHRKLDLDGVRMLTVGQLAEYFSEVDSHTPIPAYVMRTLADLERQAHSKAAAPGQETR